MDDIQKLINKYGGIENLKAEIRLKENKSSAVFFTQWGRGRRPKFLYQLFALQDAFDEFEAKFPRENQEKIASRILVRLKKFNWMLKRKDLYSDDLNKFPDYFNDLDWIINLKIKTVVNDVLKVRKTIKQMPPLSSDSILTTCTNYEYEKHDDPRILDCDVEKYN